MDITYLVPEMEELMEFRKEYLGANLHVEEYPMKQALRDFRKSELQRLKRKVAKLEAALKKNPQTL